MPALGVCVVSQHTLRQTPPMNRITDSCKNITFPQLRLWPVIITTHKVWRKVIFSVACVKNSVHRGVCLSACWDKTPPLRAPPETTPPGPGTPWEKTPPWSRPPKSSACWEIRSTSGRYASYWNAILLNK